MDEFARFNLIGCSSAFLAQLNLVKKYTTCDATVLIEGETGTGKELIARAIHYLSRRHDLPFIGLNCGALPDSLVESELFGHARGAFTDAKEMRAGLVAQAKGGTLFLDEVEAMSLHAQVALLRFLQDKEYRPLGGTLVKDANVRILASSNADLKSMAQQGAFRADLLYRLDVLPLRLPPLREREGDALRLAEAFVERLNQQFAGPPKVLHPNTAGVLAAHTWPGNVRELENLVQRRFLLSTGTIIELVHTEDEPRNIAPMEPEPFRVAKARAVAQFERAYVAALLTQTRGNLSLAARVAGKDRSDIGRLARKHGLHRGRSLHRREAS